MPRTHDAGIVIPTYNNAATIGRTLGSVERNPENRGICHSHNRGAALADAEAILFLGHDDEFLPDHVAVCVQFLRDLPEAANVRTGVERTDSVHPHWHAAIAGSLVVNLCVRADCHEFAGGFHDHPELMQPRAEGALSSDLLPGNALDIQYEKIRLPSCACTKRGSPPSKARPSGSP